MPKRFYTGSHDEVQVHLPSGAIMTVQRGTSIEVNASDAKGLDDQPDAWSLTAEGTQAKPKRARKPRTKKAPQPDPATPEPNQDPPATPPADEPGDKE